MNNEQLDKKSTVAAQFLVKTVKSKPPKANIFADRSGLVLFDVLMGDEELSVRELSRSTEVSVGQVQKVIAELVHQGVVKATGVRTAKKYQLKKRGQLFRQWLSSYSISDKCRFYNYNSGYSREEIEKRLVKSKISDSVSFGLHAAARAVGKSFTNLETTEFYLKNPDNRAQIEKQLRLEPCERGYQVLLVEPYYKLILEKRSATIDGLSVSPALLTVLDLWHFPLRGEEQAEHLLRRHPDLKKISLALATEQDGRKKSR